MSDDPSRRRFFRHALTGTIAACSATVSMAQDPPSPDSALQELIGGNRRFVSGRLTHHEQDLTILKQHTVAKQEPFAAVLSCSDSRVPVELIFDQSIGHIFVTRIAGNVVTPEVVASIEFATTVLGAPLVLVMGHAGCGAVKAAIEGKEVPGQISALFPHLRPAVDHAGSDLEAAIKANAKIQAGLLRQGSTVISGLLREKKVKVLAAHYDLASGSVTLLE